MHLILLLCICLLIAVAHELSPLAHVPDVIGVFLLVLRVFRKNLFTVALVVPFPCVARLLAVLRVFRVPLAPSFVDSVAVRSFPFTLLITVVPDLFWRENFLLFRQLEEPAAHLRFPAAFRAAPELRVSLARSRHVLRLHAMQALWANVSHG